LLQIAIRGSQSRTKIVIWGDALLWIATG